MMSIIRGTVEAAWTETGIALLEPRIAVGVAGGNQVFQTEETVIDTGFTGWLTLPKDTVMELELTYYGQRRVVLANGEYRVSDIYSALVSWHGRSRPALVHQSDGKPLIGMALLTGSRLTVDAWEGGDVTVAEVV